MSFYDPSPHFSEAERRRRVERLTRTLTDRGTVRRISPNGNGLVVEFYDGAVWNISGPLVDEVGLREYEGPRRMKKLF